MTTNQHPLVSIITPCYNCEKCIHRLFDSIIAQTYRPIEFILINDGSKDNTLKVVEDYRAKFANAGISFTYRTQENKGPGGAINVGLKLFTGEFLCWPDADDYFEPTSVEEHLKALEEHPEVAVVTSDAVLRPYDNLDKCLGTLSSRYKHTRERRQFEFLLDGKSIFGGGMHMVRTSCFLEVNPKRDIYEGRRGQNWQLLLPLYYKYERYFFDRKLYNYVISPYSLSQKDKNLERKMSRYNEHYDILTHTLQQIAETQHADLSVYFDFIDNKYAKLIMKAAIRYHAPELFLKTYLEKKNSGKLDFKDKLLYLKYKVLGVFWHLLG